MERWAQLGDPTPRARLAQIEGFLDFCMMDRAWTRLKSMPPSEAWATKTQLLTARMFIARGWPKRAEALLEGLPTDAHDTQEIATLRAAAAQPPRRSPQHPPEPGEPLETRLSAAEAYLATGAYLLAKRELEQLKRTHPDNERVDDLLWALRGDYDLQQTTLPDLVDRIAPPHSLASGGALPADGSETGESLEGYDGGNGSFPRLFGGNTLPDAVDGMGDPEITQATSLEAIQEMAVAVDIDVDGDEDTQILRVIPADGAAAGLHLPEPTDEGSGFTDELEHEDDVVVMMTRQAERQPPHRLELPRRIVSAPKRDLPPPPKVRLTMPEPELELEPLEPVEPVGPLGEDDRLVWMLTLAGVVVAGVGVVFGILAAWSAGVL